MKTKTLHEKYCDKKAIAVYAENAFGGLEILDVVHACNDYVVVSYNYDKRYSVRKHKIYSTKRERLYFIKNGKRYYLDAFIKI